jgi:hypothetical protein
VALQREDPEDVGAGAGAVAAAPGRFVAPETLDGILLAIVAGDDDLRVVQVGDPEVGVWLPLQAVPPIALTNAVIRAAAPSGS